jgi:hypothetical protein
MPNGKVGSPGGRAPARLRAPTRSSDETDAIALENVSVEQFQSLRRVCALIRHGRAQAREYQVGRVSNTSMNGSRRLRF